MRFGGQKLHVTVLSDGVVDGPCEKQVTATHLIVRKDTVSSWGSNHQKKAAKKGHIMEFEEVSLWHACCSVADSWSYNYGAILLHAPVDPAPCSRSRISYYTKDNHTKKLSPTRGQKYCRQSAVWYFDVELILQHVLTSIASYLFICLTTTTDHNSSELAAVTWTLLSTAIATMCVPVSMGLYLSTIDGSPKTCTDQRTATLRLATVGLAQHWRVTSNVLSRNALSNVD